VKCRLVFAWALSRDYAVFARLKPGVSPQASQASLDIASAALREQYPDTVGGFGFVKTRLIDNLYDGQEKPALALAGIAGFFLLLACVNVANLQLARSVSRQREEQIRAALGASRWQQVRRRLVESLLLAGAGTGVGLLLPKWIEPWLRPLVPSNITGQLGIEPVTTDGRVLVVAGAMGILAGLAAGMASVLKTPPDSRLLSSGSRTGRSLRERRLMDSFVVVQFTIALALLAGAGLMIRNFEKLIHRNLGLDTRHLLTMRVSITGERYQEASGKRELVRRLVQAAEEAPGVASAGVTTVNPLGGGTWWAPVVTAGHEGDSRVTSNMVNHRLVTPNVLRAMGVPLERGRFLTAQDSERAAPVVVVSARAARKFWPDRDPIGQRIRIDRPGQPWLQVVGVAGDVVDSRDPADPRETWYLPYAQFAETPAAENIFLMVRSALDPEGVERSVEQAIGRVDPTLAIFERSSMDGYYHETLSRDRQSAIVLAVLAAFGLLLGSLGIYGTLSLAVGERVREIGVRMALGADRRHVLRLMLLQGLRLSLFGTLFGFGAAYALGRVLASQISEVRPGDPISMGGAALLLLAVAGGAILLPARRASAVEPMVALRQE
jgi:predicted permease